MILSNDCLSLQHSWLRFSVSSAIFPSYIALSILLTFFRTTKNLVGTLRPSHSYLKNKDINFSFPLIFPFIFSEHLKPSPRSLRHSAHPHTTTTLLLPAGTTKGREIKYKGVWKEKEKKGGKNFPKRVLGLSILGIFVVAAQWFRETKSDGPLSLSFLCVPQSPSYSKNYYYYYYYYYYFYNFYYSKLTLDVFLEKKRKVKKR